jgi:hypothetical protein
MSFEDITFELALQMILCITEIGTGIIAASSPFLRPLFDRLFHGIAWIRDNSLGKNSSRFTKYSAATRSYHDSELGKSVGDSDVALHDVGGLITQASEGASCVGLDEERDNGSARTDPNNAMYAMTIFQQ